ncbi:hypothetical protein BGX26_001975 [Mortierella sp. AD094]|nr:hypothetical protein BGX26_001975 [Mortierella sp. AD094]
MAHPPPAYSSPPHHNSLLTQPFPYDKLPAQPGHNAYDDKKPQSTYFPSTPKPMPMPEPAKTPLQKPMPMPEPAKTPLQKPMTMPEPAKTPLHKPMTMPEPAKTPLHKPETGTSTSTVGSVRPAKQQEAAPASSGPRNPQLAAPVYRNPQAIYDGPAISTSAATNLAPSKSSKAPQAIISTTFVNSNTSAGGSSSSNSTRPTPATSHSTLAHSQSSSSSHGSTTSQPYKPQPYQPQPYRPSSTQTPSASAQPSSSTFVQNAQPHRPDTMHNSFVNNFNNMSVGGRPNPVRLK